MPVDKSHSRFGPRDGLGVAQIWTCPGCGAKVEGRRIEQGCPLCGAGDPAKNLPPRPKRQAEREEPRKLEVGGFDSRRAAGSPRTQGVPGKVGSLPAPAPSDQAQCIYRLIEYTFQPGADVDAILRNSLVGRINLGAVELVATIVDTVDDQQADRLRMARLQPGVWLANPEAMKPRRYRIDHLVGPGMAAPSTLEIDAEYAFAAARREKGQMETPDTGPQFTEDHRQLAERIVRMGGIKLCYTLALALQALAEDEAVLQDPARFLSKEEMLQLANALMQQVPGEWEGDVPEAAPEVEKGEA